MRPSSLVLLALAGLLAAGCAPRATAGLSVDGDRRTYVTTPVRLGTASSGAFLGATQDYSIRAAASCAGAGCVPDRVVVTLADDDNAVAQADFEAVQVETDTETYEWFANVGLGDIAIVPNGRGDLLNSAVPFAMFADVARSGSVTVRLGSQEFQLPEDRRRAFRDLVAAFGPATP